MRVRGELIEVLLKKKNNNNSYKKKKVSCSKNMLEKMYKFTHVDLGKHVYITQKKILVNEISRTGTAVEVVI